MKESHEREIIPHSKDDPASPLSNDHPSVTIVTVVRNGIDCLEETILNVTAQTWSNLEYIIVDGASTDGTVSLIKKYDQSISKWISEPDKGIYDAMNKGVDLANNEWIVFINAGDSFVSPNVIESVFSQNVSQAEIVYGDTCFTYPNHYRRTFRAKKIDQFWQGMRFYHQSCFVRKTLLQSNRFNLQYKISADYDLLFRLYRQNRKFFDANLVISQMSTGGVSYEYRSSAFTEEKQIALSHQSQSIVADHYQRKVQNARKNSFVRKFFPPTAFMLTIHIMDTIQALRQFSKLSPDSNPLWILATKELQHRILSTSIFEGFVFNSSNTPIVSQPTAATKLRPLRRNDFPKLLALQSSEKISATKDQIIRHLSLIESGIQTGYVGADNDDNPCVICWLTRPSENTALQARFKGLFPILKEGEALFEFASTHPDYDSESLIHWMSNHLCRIATKEGYTRLLTFASDQDIESQNALRKIGWQASLQKKNRWRFFRRSLELIP
jgi:glycosyltransferase involved in cell wall biosynthesis